MYGLWNLTHHSKDIRHIIFKSKSQKFHFGYDDSMYELKVKLFQFIFSAYLLYRFENISQLSSFIVRFLLHFVGPVWNWELPLLLMNNQ